jgi:hypothetical protein
MTTKISCPLNGDGTFLQPHHNNNSEGLRHKAIIHYILHNLACALLLLDMLVFSLLSPFLVNNSSQSLLTVKIECYSL